MLKVPQKDRVKNIRSDEFPWYHVPKYPQGIRNALYTSHVQAFYVQFVNPFLILLCIT